MAYVIAEPCIGTKDTACVDACPVDCIHPKKNTTYDDGRPGFEEVPQLYIDPVECIDCGACVPVCPVSAIFALDDLPEKWKQYTELNESYVKAGSTAVERILIPWVFLPLTAETTSGSCSVQLLQKEIPLEDSFELDRTHPAGKMRSNLILAAWLSHG